MLKQAFCYLVAVLCLAMPAYGLVEVCGNGVDDDSSGGDEACPSPDADGDGYTTDGTLLGFDCDDTNRRIGIGTEITTGCSAGQFKTCQSNGTYTGCVSGTGYHVNPSGGSDSNAGTSYAAAFASWDCISSYSSGAPACNKHSVLTCGDHVYFWPGTYSTKHANSFPGDAQVGMMIDSKSCSGNPIYFHFLGTSTITLASSSGAPVAPIFLYNSTGITLRGNGLVDCTGNHIGGRGCLVAATVTDLDISGVKAHDNYSDGDNNGAHFHLYGGGSNARIHHNELYDIRSDGGNGNSVCQIVLFSRPNDRVDHNVIRFASGSTVHCGVRVKHGAATGTFELDHNKFSNIVPLISAANSENIHHNVVGEVTTGTSGTCNTDTDAAAFGLCENGGNNTGYDGTQLIQYNTVNIGRAWTWRPQPSTGIGTLQIDHNVWRDTATSYQRGISLGNVDNYGSDADYTSVIGGGKLTNTADCVHNPVASNVYWSLYGSSPLTAGDWFTYAEYVSAGYCSGCVNANPTLNADLIATTNAVCIAAGWNSGEVAPPPTTTTTTTTSTTTTTTTTTTLVAPGKIRHPPRRGTRGRGSRHAPWWILSGRF